MCFFAVSIALHLLTHTPVTSQVLLVVSSEVPPDQLFSSSSNKDFLETPILDLEQLQFEGAVEGERRGS